MKIIYTKAVAKDVGGIKEDKVKDRIRRAIAEIKKADTLREVSGVRKMKGHPTAFRIRIGNYRLGLLFEKDTVTLMRFLKRSDIYKVFP